MYVCITSSLPLVSKLFFYVILAILVTADLVCSNDDFSLLCGSLQQTGLDVDLDNKNRRWTVFAPTDEAFLSLDSQIADEVFSTMENLEFVLLYHTIVNQEVFSSELECSERILMTNLKETRTVCVGAKVYQKGGGNEINQRPEIVGVDITTCNGVVHVVNQVILPFKLPDGHIINNPAPTYQKSPTYQPAPTYQKRPTHKPAPQPTFQPAPQPTFQPAPQPTPDTPYPTPYPTPRPTPRPTKYPTYRPTRRPTKYPTYRPTTYPTYRPTRRPTKRPTKYPTYRPTSYPTPAPEPEHDNWYPYEPEPYYPEEHHSEDDHHDDNEYHPDQDHDEQYHPEEHHSEDDHHDDNEYHSDQDHDNGQVQDGNRDGRDSPCLSIGR